MAAVSHFECSKCRQQISADKLRSVCPTDGGSLYVRYDLTPYVGYLGPTHFAGRPATMWRYSEVLPDAEPVSLGEGFTPMLTSRRIKGLFIKDEGLNPTGSFKARGLSAAVTMCKHYGIRKIAIPSAGNAASALAAYAAAADIEAHIFMPKDVPRPNLIECKQYGAKVTLIDGLISDCARIVSERKAGEGWFDISTTKEPFRVEGKKTMGYEVAEQMNWQLPDAIIYPAGGGVGLIGMWKAFEELEQLGLIDSKRPRMIAVQAAGCEPITRAWRENRSTAEFFQNARTIAAGLRVPKPYADYLVLEILKQSSGTAVSATDDEIVEAVGDLASGEGIFAAPEGAASWVAYQKLIDNGFLRRGDLVVLFNTGSGLKYTDVIDEYTDASAIHAADGRAR